MAADYGGRRPKTESDRHHAGVNVCTSYTIDVSDGLGLNHDPGIENRSSTSEGTLKTVPNLPKRATLLLMSTLAGSRRTGNPTDTPTYPRLATLVAHDLKACFDPRTNDVRSFLFEMGAPLEVAW
jgi:hypothetical protein